LDCSNVKELVIEIAGYLAHDLRLSGAAWAPDVERHTFANERTERLIELRGFHGISFDGFLLVIDATAQPPAAEGRLYGNFKR
jgi:hypothetical protein